MVLGTATVKVSQRQSNGRVAWLVRACRCDEHQVGKREPLLGQSWGAAVPSPMPYVDAETPEDVVRSWEDLPRPSRDGGRRTTSGANDPQSRLDFLAGPGVDNARESGTLPGIHYVRRLTDTPLPASSDRGPPKRGLGVRVQAWCRTSSVGPFSTMWPRP